MINITLIEKIVTVLLSLLRVLTEGYEREQKDIAMAKGEKDGTKSDSEIIDMV